jgi:hypothetical protein
LPVRAVFSVDVQPPLPKLWRALTTGPLPHLAGPSWANHAHQRLATAYASSPAAHAANMTAPLLLIQVPPAAHSQPPRPSTAART